MNGRIAHDPETPVRLPQDRIEVDGVSIEKHTPIYLVMNKPRGLVTTASDEKARPTIYSLLPQDIPWVGPIGRLDKASEGLLLLTNDSEWAHKITAPASHLEKTYHVQVNRVVDAALLAKMMQGCLIDGGYLRVKGARLLRHGDKRSWLEITLDEGKNRQIRRLLQALDIEVLRLLRISIGPLRLSDLKKGSVRSLSAREKQVLDEAVQGPETSGPKKSAF